MGILLIKSHISHLILFVKPHFILYPFEFLFTNFLKLNFVAILLTGFGGFRKTGNCLFPLHEI